MNSDLPINSSKDDFFNYASYAEIIAAELCCEWKENLIVGIESQWGSGKTSFLNLTRSAIKDKLKENVVVLEYCPWIYATLDALLLGFCQQLAAQLSRSVSDGNSMEKIGNAFEILSNVVALTRFIPGAQIASEAGSKILETSADALKAAAVFSKTDIFEAKKTVQNAINNSDKRIVVVIDDIDRLSPSEIRLLFQFIKAVADFKSVTYLLAYDPRPVIKALSFDGMLNGEEYLKKFIQLPIKLPRLSKIQLTGFLIKALQKLKSRRGVSKAALALLEKSAVALIELPGFHTPRDIVRVLNLFRLRLHDIGEEVEILTVFRYVCLDIFCPQAIEIVRSHPGKFLSLTARYHAEFSRANNESLFGLDDEKRLEKRRELFQEIPEAIRSPALRLTEQLFSSSEESGGVTSTASPHAVLKLLYGGNSPLAFSVSEALAFFANQKRSKIIHRVKISGALQDWFYFLTGVIEKASLVNPLQMALLLVKNALEVDREQPTRTDKILRISADFVPRVVKAIDGEEEKARFVRDFIEKSDDIFVAGILLVHLSEDVGLWRQGVSYPAKNLYQTEKPSEFGLPPERILKLQKNWLERVRAVAEKGGLIDDVNLASILHRWGQFPDNDYSEVQLFIAECGKHGDLLPLFRHFAFETGIDGLWKILPADVSGVEESIKRYNSNSEERERALRIIDSVVTQRKREQQNIAKYSDA